MVFRQALNDESIGHRFKEDVNNAVSNLGLSEVDWGKGIWQKILQLKEVRKKYIHTNPNRDKLFLDCSLSDYYVYGIQQGIIAIYEHAEKPLPKWVYYFDDRGWDYGEGSIAHGTVIREGANEEDTNSIIVKYVYKGKEYKSEILPPNADYLSVVSDIADNIRIPITHIKVYQRCEVIFEKQVIMRGGS